MKKIIIITLIISLLALSGCKPKENKIDDDVIIPECGTQFTMEIGQHIPFESIDIPYSTVKGNVDNFINYCKPRNLNPIYISNSIIRTHHIILGFDAIYPLDALLFEQAEGNQTIQTISIEVSLDGTSFKRILNNINVNQKETNISLGGHMAKKIKIVFDADELTKGIQHIVVTLADGVIIKEDHEWSNTFLRYKGWTGADGIFTFNLTDGNESIGAMKDTVGFIFSDTFIGEVYENNKLRKSAVMINNSLGYMDTKKPFEQAFDFDWRTTNGLADTVYLPNAYIGNQANNLLDGDGLTYTTSKDALFSNSSEGLSFLSNDAKAEITIDLKTIHQLSNLYLWNYNANPNLGAKQIELLYSGDGIDYISHKTYLLNKANGTNIEPYTHELDLSGLEARYIKIRCLESYDLDQVGLGKLMIFNAQNEYIFGQATDDGSSNYFHLNEKTARLWLQDGVVLDNYLYVFPILVKDIDDIFKVHRVGMIKTPIKNEKLDYENAEYMNTPLQVQTKDGGVIYLGAGILNNVHQDGYIYIYGYKDLNGRGLVVGRFKPEDIEDYNQWTYFDGNAFVKDINNIKPLIYGVSAELSVTYIESGAFENKYMLVVMENTTSGKISYSLSDTPYGSFSDYQMIYQTSESTYLRGAFSYNAKMHPALSIPGNYLISYNVNTTQLGALSDARIYYPRFIRMIEVKK